MLKIAVPNKGALSEAASYLVGSILRVGGGR